MVTRNLQINEFVLKFICGIRNSCDYLSVILGAKNEMNKETNWRRILCSDEEKINCSFEEGFCFWRHDADDDGDWMRINGSERFPGLNRPDVDHTFANQSGKHHICAVSFSFPSCQFCSSWLHFGHVPNHTPVLGYYIITPMSPGSWEKIVLLRSLPLAPAAESMCLGFWLVLVSFSLGFSEV